MTANNQTRGHLTAMTSYLAIVCLLLSLSTWAQRPPASDAATRSGVTLRKVMPPRVTVGEPFLVQLVVRAHEASMNVEVRDAIPETLEFQGSNPQASQQGNTLIWNLGNMRAGEEKTIALRVTATREGQIASCATVTTTQEICVATVAGSPRLAVSKVGPETALLGSTIPYQIVVKNVGTAAARDVTLTDVVPAGLTHASGEKNLVNQLGTLEPGQERRVTIQLQAATRGQHCNRVVVTSSNAQQVEDQACTLVQQPNVAIAKTGTKNEFILRDATYTITVTNTGDTDLTRLTVTDQMPASYQITDPAGGRVTQQNQIIWNLDRLPRGRAVSWTVRAIGTQAGQFCNVATVNSAENLTAQAEACTLWRGHPALLMELVDTEDPIQPGQQTIYIIRITNQGTAADSNIRVVGTIPPELKALSGLGDSAVTIQGNRFTTGVIPELQPKQAVEWRVEVEAVKVGDARFRAQMTSELLKKPVTEEESTQVY